MVIVEYSSGKLVRRALLFFALCLIPIGTVWWVLFKFYLFAHGARALVKAGASDKAAIILHARGMEIRTFWRKRFLPYDDYTHVSTDTLFLGAAFIPIPGPAMLVIHSDKRGWLGKRTVSIPIGFLKLAKDAIPLVGEAIEVAVMPHRVAGEAWNTGYDERRVAEGAPPPPRQLAAPAEREARVAARRDPLEGAPRGQLDRPPSGGFGRKVG